MKHWCMKRSTCSWTARTTVSGLCPRFWQAIPPAKSRYSRPSASQIVAPSARATTRSVVATPRGTKRSRSSRTDATSCSSRVSTRPTLVLRARAEERRAGSPRLVAFPGYRAGVLALADLQVDPGAAVQRLARLRALGEHSALEPVARVLPRDSPDAAVPRNDPRL